MEITYLGLSALRLRGRELQVLVDPLDPGIAPGSPKLRPDIIVRTEGATDPMLLRFEEGRPQQVQGPGEYEIRGVAVTGLPININELTVMRVEVDDVRVVALGKLTRQLTGDEIDQLGHVDVLAIPVGGSDALDAAEATKLVRSIEPAVVVPVRHEVEGLPGGHAPVAAFAKEMGVAEGWTAQPKLNLTGSIGGNDETRVVILEAKPAILG